MARMMAEALVDAWLGPTRSTHDLICASCVREGEEGSPATFGDFSICDRCGDSVTSTTPAVFVPREA